MGPLAAWLRGGFFVSWWPAHNARMQNFLASLCICSMILAAAPATAEIYRWVDDDGKVHFSQTPPPDQAASKVKPPPGTSRSASPAANSGGQDFLQARDAAREKTAEQNAEAAALAQQKATTCSQARAYLKYLDEKTPRRLMVENSDGSASRMTEGQFNERRANAQKVIADNCSR